MRSPFIALALVLVACGRGDRGTASATHQPPRPPPIAGPDALVLRVPRAGGIGRIVAYPHVDSTVWTSTDALPALDRVLAFDDDEGTIAFVDSHGRAGRLDLRVGTSTVVSEGRLASPASVAGSTIFGVATNGSIVRLTPSGSWTFTPPKPGELVFPQRDTSILVLSRTGDSSTLWRIRPPVAAVAGSIRIPLITHAVRTAVGDRVYFASERGLFAVETRTLTLTPLIHEARRIAALAVTPSGDRIYVAMDSSPELDVVDRYRNRVQGHIALPGQARDLRIDPLGRYLLVRSAGHDSTWVIATGTNRFVATIPSIWRGDLPFVAPDGAIAAAVGRDVWFIDPTSMKPVATVEGGAADFWFSFWWTGFRPRGAGLDTSVEFDTTQDTGQVNPPTPPAPPPRNLIPQRGAHTEADTLVAPQRTYWVQFAAYLAEQRAEDAASKIHVDGETGRVVIKMQGGVPIYKVVLGPYPSRADADRVAAASGQPSAWVYEGPP